MKCGEDHHRHGMLDDERVALRPLDSNTHRLTRPETLQKTGLVAYPTLALHPQPHLPEMVL
jgi:hypothetical protein